MAEHNAHINYTLADIERYLQGRMNAREMHDMEKAALQDPFLADAIEGYSDADNAVSETHLNEITALLQQPKKNAKVVTMASRRFQWLRAAAAVVVILGAAFISYYALNDNDTKDGFMNLAQEKAKTPQPADTVRAEDSKRTGLIAEPLLTDSSKAQAKLLPGNEREELRPIEEKDGDKSSSGNATTYLAKPSNQPESEPKLVGEQQFKPHNFSITKSPENKLSNVPPPTTLRDTIKRADLTKPLQGKVPGVDVNANNNLSEYKAKEPSQNYSLDRASEQALKRVTTENNKSNQSQLTNTFQGKILDNNNLPVANAFVRINNSNSNIGTVTDQKGNFKISFADSVLNITVSALNYQPETTTLKNNASASIVLNEVDNSLSEVVVTGFGTKRKDSNTHSDTLATPANGWDSFEEYVYKKLDKSYDSTANYADLKGDVELEFLVDRQGKPYNFKVLQSLNDSADNKAIEIVKEGPKWISGKKKKKGKVLIHF